MAAKCCHFSDKYHLPCNLKKVPIRTKLFNFDRLKRSIKQETNLSLSKTCSQISLGAKNICVCGTLTISGKSIIELERIILPKIVFVPIIHHLELFPDKIDMLPAVENDAQK